MAGRAQDVFEGAVELAGAEREAYLRGACGTDRSLREEVDSLLRAYGRGAEFLASPTAAPAGQGDTAATIVASIREGPGTRIGAYKLLQLIGEGGFGSVFMADQERPVQRKVALKIIKLGMDTRQVIARFEAERQALAMMDHPNIARVLDAGATETGRPFFVMELVKGDPIVEYCDKNSLSIEDRLGLFTQVCHAVQHAHTKGIIHRDLKPSNILVSTQDGRPNAKVIDFGIAKATASRLTEKTLFTEHRALIGTPEYMSPEQAEGSMDIDTRTDVYSLGVLLYELLTGTTPFGSKELRSAAYAEIQRIIREVEPPKPSTRLSHNTDTLASVAAHRHTEPKRLGALVRGELDWIVMRCLEKDRQRRYETANGLAMDVQRYLAGEAVVAAPPSAAYRFRKFIWRNRGKAAAAGVVAAALVLGMIGTGLALGRALRAESGLRVQLAETQRAQEAERARADELRQVSDFQGAMLEQVDPTTAGVRLTEDVNRRFAEALARANVPEAERAGRAEEFGALWAQVNATDAAATLIDETILRPALRAVEEQFKDQPMVDVRLRQVLVRLYKAIGRLDAAYALQESVLATSRRELGEEHESTLAAISNMGSLLAAQGRLAEAEPYSREAVERTRRVLGEEHSQTLSAINNMGNLLVDQGRLAEAEPYLREALEKGRRLQGEEHRDVMTTTNNLCVLLSSQGRFAEAEQHGRDVLERRRRVLGEEHAHTLNSINNMGTLLVQQGRLAEAEPYLREGVEKSRRLRGEEHPDTLVAIINLGNLLLTQGRHAEAEPYVRILEVCRRVLGEEHPNTLNAISNMGSMLRDTGRFAEAEAYCREALDVRRRVLGEEHMGTLNDINNMGILLVRQGRLAEAEPYAREAMEKSRRSLGEEHTDTLNSLDNLGSVLLGQGKFAQAERVLAEGVGACERAFTGPHPVTATLLHHHAQALLAMGRLDEALPGARRAAAMYFDQPDWNAIEAQHAALILGAILSARGEPDEALDVQRQLLSLRRRAARPESPQLGDVLAQFGLALLQHGSADSAREAAPILQECLEIRLKTMPDDWRTFNTRSTLGGALLGQDRLAEAEPLLLEGYQGMIEREAAIPPQARARLHEALERLVRLYEAVGNEAEATAWRGRLEAARAGSR